MSKKKAAATDVPSTAYPEKPVELAPDPPKRAAPEKDCVKCGKGIHARVMTCPHCGTEQPKKEKPEVSAKPKPKGSSSGAVANLILVAKLAGELGGLHKLLEIAEQIDTLGGTGEVLEAVEALQGLKNLDL